MQVQTQIGFATILIPKQADQDARRLVSAGCRARAPNLPTEPAIRSV